MIIKEWQGCAGAGKDRSHLLSQILSPATAIGGGVAWIRGWGPNGTAELGNKIWGAWHGRKGTELCGELRMVWELSGLATQFLGILNIKACFGGMSSFLCSLEDPGYNRLCSLKGEGVKEAIPSHHWL